MYAAMCGYKHATESIVPGERKGLDGEGVGLKISGSTIVQ